MNDASQESPAVLVLEDRERYQKAIMDSIPSGLSAELVANSEAFRTALQTFF